MPALVTTRGHRFALTTVGIPDIPQDLALFVFFDRNNVALTPLTFVCLLIEFVSAYILNMF
jgi:hypothetical protein